MTRTFQNAHMIVCPFRTFLFLILNVALTPPCTGIIHYTLCPPPNVAPTLPYVLLNNLLDCGNDIFDILIGHPWIDGQGERPLILM